MKKDVENLIQSTAASIHFYDDWIPESYKFKLAAASCVLEVYKLLTLELNDSFAIRRRKALNELAAALHFVILFSIVRKNEWVVKRYLSQFNEIKPKPTFSYLVYAFTFSDSTESLIMYLLQIIKHCGYTFDELFDACIKQTIKENNKDETI